MLLCLLTASLALLLVGVLAGAARGLIPANGLIGLRTPALLRSEEGWRAGHRAALRIMAPAGVVVAGAAVAVAVLEPWGEQGGYVAGLVLLGVLVAVAVLATVVAHRTARGLERGPVPAG